MKHFTWRHQLTIAVLAFAAFAPVLKLGFIWDDHVIIETNASIRNWSPSNLKHDFVSDNTQGQGDNYYRPLQAISHRIDYSIWGLRPFGYHLTGLLFHVGCALLIAQFVLALGFAPLSALLTAALFAVHPIGIEQFLTASGRTTQMSLFFSLGTILFLLKKKPIYVALGIGSYALALLSKENSIITPALVAATFVYLKQPKRRYWLLAPLVLMSVIYLWVRQAVVLPPPQITPSLTRLFITHVFPRTLAHYVAVLLVPWNLHSHHLIPRMSYAWPLYLIAAVALPLWFWTSKRRTALFCFSWFVLNILPMIPPMIFGGFMLDHWGYSMAFGILLPLGLFFSDQWQARKGRWHYWLGMTFFPMLIGWALLVHLNVELRGTDEKIYRWALHFTTSHHIKYNLGALLVDTGRPAEGIPLLEEFRAAYPEDAAGLFALAKGYYLAGEHNTSISLLRELLRLHPGYPPAIVALKTAETARQSLKK